MKYASVLRMLPVAGLCVVLFAGQGGTRSLDPLTDFDASGQIANPDQQGINSLATVLSDHGDYQSVLKYYDPQIHAQTQIEAVYAAALAAAGDSAQARQTLDGLKAERQSVWALIAEAIIARKEGDLAAADEAIERALPFSTGNAYAHNVAGTIDAQRADWPSAVQHFSEAARLAPKAALYLANLGGVHVQNGDFGQAQRALDQAIALNEAFCAPRLARATLYDLEGNIEGVVSDLSACLVAEPNAGAARALVVALTDRAQLDRAIKALAQHKDLLGEEAAALEAELALRTGEGTLAIAALAEAALPAQVLAMNRAYAYLLLGQDALAAREMAAATTAGPSARSNGTLLRGVELLSAGAPSGRYDSDTPMDALWVTLSTRDDAQQQAAWSATANLVPGFSTVGLVAATPAALAEPAVKDHLVRGTLFLARGMNLPAATAFDAAAEQAGADAIAPLRYLQAAAIARAGNRDAAETALRQSLDASPEFVAAHLFYGDIMSRQGKFPDALVAFEAAFRIQPTAAHAIRVGATAEVAGEIDTAIDAYRAVIDQVPDSHVGYNQLAWIMVSNERDLVEAEELARKALELAPDDGPTLDTLGWALFQQGRAGEALTYLRRAFETGGASAPLIAYHLAQAEVQAGDPARAKELIDLILSFGEQAFVFSAHAQTLRDSL